MSGINVLKDIISSFDPTALLQIVYSVIPALLCITLHELCHGLTALALGDTTARDAGRLSLNPIKHIDVFGLLMMVVFRVGWAKPVPIDARRFKKPKQGMAITALAGPVSNILLAMLLLFLFGVLYYPLSDSSIGEIVLMLIEITAQLSVGLGLFNLIPIPPLDGSKVLFALLPDSAYAVLMRYERYGMILLYALVALGAISGPLQSAIGFVFTKLTVFAQWGLELYLLFV